MHLKELLGGTERRTRVLDDCCQLIDEEVKSKGGFSGIAIKASYAVVKGVKPTFLRESFDHLLDSFADHLNPVFQEAKQAGQPLEAFFATHQGRVADALLAITDERATKAKSAVVLKAYNGLRGKAKENVEAAATRLGALVEKYDHEAP